MAAIGEEILKDDDLDAVLMLIEEDILVEDHGFIAEVKEIVDAVGENQPANSFSCDQCDKVCKTSRGLTRHRNVKHKQSDVEAFMPENMLHPLYFKRYINNSVSKLALDECYSEKTRKEFADYQVTVDDANYSYQLVRNVIGEFRGNAEKFYPAFYKSVSEVVAFRNLSRRSSVILGFEVANHVLAHLTGSNVNESTVDFTPPIKFSHKEQNIIKYLSGYVFGTLYRRIRTSKSCQNMFGVQSLHILLAGKLSLEENSSNDILIRAKDRGGLWTVTAEVFEIFSHVESKFRAATVNFHQNIDSKKIVSDLLKNPIVLCNYNKLRYDESTEKISKEIAMNLLEHLIMLYVRVRIFSLVQRSPKQ